MKISTICFALLTFVSRLQAGEPGHLYELQTNDLKESRTLAATLAGGKVSFGDESLPIANLVSLRVPKVPLPPLPAESHIVLANGDRIAGDIIGGDGLSLRFAANFGSAKPVELTLPLSAVSAIWFVSPPQDHPLDAGKYPWVDASKKSDTLRLRNGDGIRGTLERFAPAGGPLRFKPAGEATAKPFEPNTIAALAFDPSLSRMKVPAGQHFRIVARSGSRITLSAASFDGKVFSGTTVTGVKFAMPQEDLLALDTVGGKVGYLADLKPKEQKSEPYGSVAWPIVANRSVREVPLRLTTRFGDETSDRGLGMHSKTTVSYDLSGKYRSFRATVGLDRLSGRKGAVDVRVLLDGKEQAIPGLKGLTADGAVEVRLDVSGAKLLTVIVEFGAGGDIGDDVNWVGAKLAE
jgi:hypothetical protein